MFIKILNWLPGFLISVLNQIPKVLTPISLVVLRVCALDDNKYL